MARRGRRGVANDEPTTAKQQIEFQLATAALAKQAKNVALTRDERRAIKRVRARREETQRQEYYRNIPVKHWRQLAGGIHHAQLRQQAARYGIPFDGSTIDLSAVLPALHRVLADYSRVIGTDDAGQMSLTALEQLRREQFKIARLRRKRLERELLPRAEVHDALALFAGRIKRAGQQLGKRFGGDAQQILDDALDDALGGLRVDDGDDLS